MKPADINILIVEDEALSAMVLRRQLESAGYKICGTVATGQQAIQACHNKKIDLILMDIHLAGEMDGIETAAHIQKKHEPNQIAVIFMTGYQDNSVRARAMQIKPLEYITKPVQAAFLQQTIQSHFALTSQ